jgi:hypothetical protein
LQWGVFEFLKGAAKLVRTGCILDTTADAVEFLDDIVDVLAANKLANTLQVTVASSQEENLLDDVVFVGSHINELRAGADRLILHMFCLHEDNNSFM